MENQHIHAQPELMTSEDVSSSVLKELEELRHFKDNAVCLWCVDQGSEENSLNWIREHAFQLT